MGPPRPPVLSAVLLLFVLLAPGAALAQERSGPPDRTRTDYSNDCLSAGCHGQLARMPWAHAPVAVGACDTCHEALEPSAEAPHRFRLVREKEQLCSHCHAPPKPQQVVHDVFARSECLSCHAPHGGPTAAMLREADEWRLCKECHPARSPHADPSLHPPAAEGRCLSCHNAHQSPHPSLLRRVDRGLCLECHADLARHLAEAAHVHQPLQTECLSCHSAHGLPEGGLLREEPRTLCLHCHEFTRQELQSDPYVHGALDDERSCLACHDAHSADNAALLEGPDGPLCMGCHDRPLTGPSGQEIANIQAELQKAHSVHPPFRDGQCSACHRPHSSTNASLLNASYAAQAYTAYSRSQYEMCFSCHDEALITEENSTATAFRNGDRNLHFVHVHRDKGRTCRLCHAPHASRSAALMREAVAFGTGGWKLPIDFKKTATGGTCATGCHAEQHYDNSNPPAPDPQEQRR